MAVVEVERCDGYAVLTLNRPEAMNALSAELRTRLAQVVRELEADPAIRVLILTGAGDRAFTAGLDLKELGAGASIADAVLRADPPGHPRLHGRQPYRGDDDRAAASAAGRPDRGFHGRRQRVPAEAPGGVQGKVGPRRFHPPQ